jgi:hypothetical protein
MSINHTNEKNSLHPEPSFGLNQDEASALIGWLQFIDEDSGEALDEFDQDLLMRLKKFQKNASG